MKDERKKYILIGMFILFIGYYGMFIMFTKNLVSTEKEKRELNRMPSLSSENYENFTADFTAFFKDYIPFRQQLTEMHNNFMVNIVHTSSNDAVIIGKKGWLFYNSKAKDPETDEVVDYNGSIQYTKEQKERVATEVQAATEYCRENGSKMVFLMAPNKSSVYKQYMPDTYREVGDEKRCEELAEYLQKNTDAEVLYPKDELIEFSKKQKTYFSNDTHWNGMGGAYVANLVADILGLEYPNIEDLNMKEEKSAEDLKYMLGVGTYLADDENKIPEYSKLYQVELSESLGNMDCYKSNNHNGKRMLILGDSFSEELVPALSVAVEELDISRSRNYQLTSEKKYDYVIYEMVERNIAIIAGE